MTTHQEPFSSLLQLDDYLTHARATFREMKLHPWDMQYTPELALAHALLEVTHNSVRDRLSAHSPLAHPLPPRTWPVFARRLSIVVDAAAALRPDGGYILPEDENLLDNLTRATSAYRITALCTRGEDDEEDEDYDF